ncbi:MAG TPA: indole-3-glycerol phosphate synthase TrpC [Firmicutes bacterium]|nr:indole-3-glycerol phosphate synthase TrpC [Bacillota bacterium]
MVDYIQAALDAGESRSFRQAITASEQLALIAEVKKASPSAGVIREDFDPVALAQAYEEAGASALSVVTERNFFQGRLEFIEQIRQATSLPILRKDFITDEYQIAESKLAGADAVLLICSILDWRRVLSLMTLTRRLSMDCLVEVHRPRELDIALIAGAGLIGINNRNLQTLEVNLQTTPGLMAHIHDPIPVVAESGISTPEDLALIKEAGCQAVLVGESLLRQGDVKSAIRELFAAEWKEAPGGSG